LQACDYLDSRGVCIGEALLVEADILPVAALGGRLVVASVTCSVQDHMTALATASCLEVHTEIWMVYRWMWIGLAENNEGGGGLALSVYTALGFPVGECGLVPCSSLRWPRAQGGLICCHST
jgi:hypothetical protein